MGESLQGEGVEEREGAGRSLGNLSPAGEGEGTAHGGEEEGMDTELGGESQKPQEERVSRDRDIGK